MTRNPEFIRNLWLVHKPVWLVLTPLVLGAIYLVLYALSTFDEERLLIGRPPWEVFAFALFCLVTVLFGSGRVVFTISAEVREHTWDGQRMSAIPPWSMAWGKFFGSTAYTWYGGSVCILLYAYTALTHSLPPADILKTIIVWIMAGIVGPAAMLAAALIGLLKAPIAERENGASLTMIFAMFAGYLAVPVLWLMLPQDGSVVWFGWPIAAQDLLVLTATAYAAWSLVGVYFLMRREFQYVNSPLPWLGFAVFSIVYAAGFGHGDGSTLVLASGVERKLGGILPFYAGILLLYVVALSDTTEWRTARRIGRCVEKREWKEVFDQTPRALYTLALLAVVVCGLILFSDHMHWPVVLGQARATDEVLVAALLFAARDVGLILLIGTFFETHKSELLAIGLLLLLQGCLPAAAYLFADPLLTLFWPVPSEHPVLTLGPALFQTIAVGAVLGHRVISIHRKVL